MFCDKEQEIKQLINYINCIIESNKVKWHVTPNTFSVTVLGTINRTFSRAELESYEQQINYLNALEENFEREGKQYPLISGNSDAFKYFLKVLQNIRNRYKICTYDFCYVHDPVFEGDQYIYIEKMQSNTGENQIRPFLFPSRNISAQDIIKDQFNFGLKNHYAIGKSILNNDNKRIEGDSTLLNVFYTFGYISVVQKLIREFIEDLYQNMMSIDPVKVGRRFIKFLSQRDVKGANYSDFRLDEKMKSNKSYKKLLKFIRQFSDDKTLLIANVPKPGHTLHLIQPSYIFWASQKSNREFLCPQRNILFCTENNNFQDSLNNLSNSTDRSLHFIVHPENLRSDEIQRLKTFISARRSQDLNPKENKNEDKKKKKEDSTIKPRVMIITALPSSFFYLDDSDNIDFKDTETFIEEDIKEFATFNAQWRRSICYNQYDVFLFSSDKPGKGKTCRINKIIENVMENLDTKNTEDDRIEEQEEYKISKEHIYFDITTKEIPESIIDKTLIHVSISPELFLNNFQIFDQLYLLIQYGYFIFQSGLSINYSRPKIVIPTFLIEIPNLDYGNVFHNFYDFPVAPTNNEIRWTKKLGSPNKDIFEYIKDEFKDIEDEDSFQNGLFHLSGKDTQIEINDQNVRDLMELIFDNSADIKYYSDLIDESKELFFEDKAKDFSCIISKAKQMIEDYSRLIINEYDDNEKRKILFLLTLRTVLYIWHLTPDTIHSIVLFVPQRLMTINAFKERNGWIFVGFFSKHDTNKTWKKGKNIIQGIDSDLTLIEKFTNDFQNDEQIHILSVTSDSKNDDITLQAQFFKTILLFLPAINFNESSSNPLNIAFILLTLFSNMDHFPQNSFQKIIADLSNKNYNIEDLKNKYAYNDYESIDWTEMDELLTYYLRNNKIDVNNIKSINHLILQLKSELNIHENIWNIINISFSKTFFARFIEIILKIYYRHFTILQGDTGCGKTSVVHLLYDVISLAKNDPNIKDDIKWSFLMIDFNGNYLKDDFDREINNVRNELSMDTKEKETNIYNEKVIIFLDEVNTSPAYNYVIDHIQNSVSDYFTYIAAVNAHIKVDPVTRNLSRVGIPQNINRQLSNIKLFSHPDENIKELTEDYDFNRYVYDVKEDQRSVLSAIINANPQEFDEEDPKYAKFFPDEEKNTIRSIITKILLQWENNTSIDLPSTTKLLSELINMIFISVRSFLELRAIFSYRDVHRCITVFTYIFDYFIKHKLDTLAASKIRNIKEKNEKKKLLMNKITSISAAIAIYISLISRFSHEEINTDEEIEKRLKDHPFQDPQDSQPPAKICMYKLILNYVSKESNWPKTTGNLPYVKDWEYITVLFAYAKCMKYVINEKKTIYPLPSLMLHLLILSLTVSASFKDRNISGKKKLSFSSPDFSSLLIIGMPGTSKSIAVEIFKKYYITASKKKNKKYDYFIPTYLCSRTSDSESLLAQFLNGAWFMNDVSSYTTKIKKSIVILEEVGLSNYNPSIPLNILHSLCDKGVLVSKEGSLPKYCKIILIQLSNYQIDFANMNRGFLFCDGLPTDSEFYSSIAFGKILKEKDIMKFFIGKDFTREILYKIAQIEEPIDSYEKTISILIDTVLEDKPAEYDEHKEFYKNVLETLWSVTQESKTKPSFYPMRPLFNLINEVTDLKYIIENPNKKKPKEDDDDIFRILQKIYFILNSFFHDKSIVKNIFNPVVPIQESPESPAPQPIPPTEAKPLLARFLNLLIEKTRIAKAKIEKAHIEKINSITLYRSFISNETDRKAILIRTQDYEAFRYLNLLNEKKKEDNAEAEDNSEEDNTEDEYKLDKFYYNFIPFQFQDVGKDCQQKFDSLFDVIFGDHRKEQDEFKMFQEEEEEYAEFQYENGNRIICSVGNDPFSDYIIDILNSINQADQCPTAIHKGFPVYLPRFPDNIKFIYIINENEIYNHELKNPVLYSLIDSLDHLFLNKQILRACNDDLPENSICDQLKVKYLLNLPLSKANEKYLRRNKNKTNEKYLLTYERSDFQYLIEALQNQPKGNEILDHHFANTCIRNLNDLIEMMEGDTNGDLPYSSAIVFTRTPVYEKLNVDECLFELINNIQGNPEDIISNAEKLNSIIVTSDIFNTPDDNTINNALSIVHAMENKIFENFKIQSQNKNDEENNKKLLYIIIFHVSENRVPIGFGCTCIFPVIWIQSIIDNSQNGTLIQEICKAVFDGELKTDSPIINRVYTKILYICIIINDKLDENKKKKVNDLFTKGLELSSSKKLYNVGDITNSLLKQISGDKSQRKASFDKIKEEVLSMINDIHENKDEKKDKFLNEELYNFNLEVKFFSTVTTLVDKKVTVTLSIIIKYFTTANLKNIKRNDVDGFVNQAYENVVRFAQVPFIKEINEDTFSSPVKSKEINPKYPELLFFNILRPFFENEIYYNSLNKMKILVQYLPPLKGMHLIDMFTYINDNYYSANGGLPFDPKDTSDKVTIDHFNDFFNSRGLISKKKKSKAFCSFMQDNEHSRPNLSKIEINISNVRSNIDSEKWTDIPYSKILLCDCYNNFLDTCNAFDNPHPCIIYSHFVNVKDFKFGDYNNDPDGKIYMHKLIPWIINFFLYGSFNDCKNDDANTNYIYNLINFIDLALQTDPTHFTIMLSTSEEIKLFIYDYLITEYCKKANEDKIDTFDYMEHLANDNTPLKTLVEKHPYLMESVKDDSISKDILKTEVSLDKRVNQDSEYKPSMYDPSTFKPFSDKSIEIIKCKFKEIRDIDYAIYIYKSWKSKSLNDLGNNNIFDNVRSKLFKDLTDLDDQFGSWLLYPEIPLLTRQIYEICKAVNESDKDKYEAEFKILQRLINPWNDDKRTTLYFWEYFVVNVEDKTFSKVSTLNTFINSSPLKNIISNCLPYYYCQYEDNDPDRGNKITKRLVISKRNEIKTFFIERLLYANTILPSNTDKTEKKIVGQIFKFVSELPFIKETKNLYIIAGFINEIIRKFRDQINLLFLIINSCQKCSDLCKVPNFKDIINDPKATESSKSLEEALEAADKYNKGENVSEKLKSYVNRLIEINNNTNFPSENKNRQTEKLHFRLVAKKNVHSNTSLMNTFLPALCHLKLNTRDEPYKLLPNAFKVLTGSKDSKNYISDTDKEKIAVFPSVFDYFEGSLAYDIFRIIDPIPEASDIFGFPLNAMANSLCDEIVNFMSDSANDSSYRVKIWNKIKNTPIPTEKPDFSNILDTLIPLFEEFDPSILNEHLFFTWENNSMPAQLNGVEAASYFLRTYKIEDEKSMLEKIQTRLANP